MNADLLLDAIGMVDDRLLIWEEKKAARPVRRAMRVLIAALLMIALTIGTALAVSPECRALLLYILNIQTVESPPVVYPAVETTEPEIAGLRQLDVENIDGEVKAFYFTLDGAVRSFEGGFYTFTGGSNGAAPSGSTFWELRGDGIAEVEANRFDHVLRWDGREFRILLDHAVLNGNLCIQVWPEGLNENPIGNGWNVTQIPGRTDVALLSVPVRMDRDYTHDYFLIDLQSGRITEVMIGSALKNMIVDACWVTEDLRYAILLGIDRENCISEYCLCDLQDHAVTNFETVVSEKASQLYFLDSETIIYHRFVQKDYYDIVKYHIPTGNKTQVLTNTYMGQGKTIGYRPIHYYGANGMHGLLYRDDGSIALMDLQTADLLELTGLEQEGLRTTESPDGSKVLIAYRQKNEDGTESFSKLGMLDTETATLKLLKREVSGLSESFSGWLDNDTFLLTAHDANNGYYAYVYDFT